MSRLHHFLTIAALISMLPTQAHAVRNPFRRSRRSNQSNDAAKEAAERRRDLAAFNADVKKLVAIKKELKAGKLTRSEAGKTKGEYHRKRNKLARDAAELKIAVPASVPEQPVVNHNGAQVDKLVGMLRKINTQIAAAKTVSALKKATQLFEKTETVLKKKDREATRKVKKAQNTIVTPQQEQLEGLIRQLKAINLQLKSKELTEETAQPLENEFKALHEQAQSIKKKISSSERIPSMQKARTLKGRVSEKLDARHKPLRKLISDLNGINKKLSGGGITETQAAQLQAEFASKQKQAQGLKSQLRSSLKIPTMEQAKIGPKRRMFGLRGASSTENARVKAQEAKEKSDSKKDTAKQTDKDMRAAEKEHEEMVRRHGADSKEAQAAKLKADRLARDRNETKAAADAAAESTKKAQKIARKKKKENSLRERLFGDDDDDDKKSVSGGMPGGGIGSGGVGIQQPGMTPQMQQQYQPAPPAVLADDGNDDESDEDDKEQEPAVDHAAQQRLAALEDHVDKTADSGSRRAARTTYDGWNDGFVIDDDDDDSWFSSNDTASQSTPVLDRLSSRANADTKEVSSVAQEVVAQQQQVFGASAFNYPGGSDGA